MDAAQQLEALNPERGDRGSPRLAMNSPAPCACEHVFSKAAVGVALRVTPRISAHTISIAIEKMGGQDPAALFAEHLA
jgi:hypothetical protein